MFRSARQKGYGTTLFRPRVNGEDTVGMAALTFPLGTAHISPQWRHVI
jgi:hypothetical protein